MMKSKIVKVEVELTKGHVEAMQEFIASNAAYADQTVKEFLEYLIRDAWGDLTHLEKTDF